MKENMSLQQSQGTPGKLPKSSPSLSKQGPMKATIPISSVMKQNSGFQTRKSPNDSPSAHWKTIDHSSGQRSPGSSLFKGKTRSANSDTIRRTASLDTLYLSGHWPRDIFYWHSGTLQLNKATQTEESDWADVRKIHSISESDNKTERMIIRSKVRTSKDSSRYPSPGENTLTTSSQTLTPSILSPTLKPNSVTMPLKPIPKSSIRSSVEGLNQEIERIVLKTGVESQTCDKSDVRQATPEGHRAPLAEIFRGSSRSKSVNTQTPQDFGSCNSSGDSHGSSPDEACKLGTSPHINMFLAREPPDGCEKVQLKSLDEVSGKAIESMPQASTFKLKPSLRSAFQVLQPAVSEAPSTAPSREEPN